MTGQKRKWPANISICPAYIDQYSKVEGAESTVKQQEYRCFQATKWDFMYPTS